MNKGGKVLPAHQEVAGEDLVESLVELGVNDLNEGGRNVFLHCCLCLKAGVYLFYGFEERF